MLWPHRQPA